MMIEKKLAAISGFPQFRFFNANMATLKMSLLKGAHGFCGIAANCYPRLISQLCAKPSDCEQINRFLTVGEAIVAHKYPQCAKIYLKNLFPEILSKCRGMNREHEWEEEELLRLKCLREMELEFK